VSRVLIVAITLAALVSACGGGAGSNAAPAPLERKSRLAAFDAAGLDKDLEIPDFTEYWTLAEEGNGNVYPVMARMGDSDVLTARLDAKGVFALKEGDQFAPRGLAAVLSSLDTLAQANWNEEKRASAAALILFADTRAPYLELVKLCRDLVNLRVGNLWVVTHDGRDGALRLLPLLVDTSQLGKEWYELDEALLSRTVRFTWAREGAGQRAAFDWVRDTSADVDPRAKVTSSSWKVDMAARLKAFVQHSERVQFDLPQDATIRDFTEFANLFAPIGYSELEPFWPALDRPEIGEAVVETRKLAVFTDSIEIARDLNLPTLSHWWRASAADRGLRAAGEIDSRRPMLAIRASADGGLATRAQDAAEWKAHGDDMGVLNALRENAGEIDLDTGLSELQVVLAMDRYARWETFLGLLEMMKSTGCFRLFVVTHDLIGPTLRLLDLALPVGDLPDEKGVAAIVIDRESTVAEGAYSVTMVLDGVEHKVTGPRFSSSLTKWSGERKADPKVLGIKLPRDEPFETLFTVLNAVAWLGMPSVTFGG
jgi:hypothetical protein